MHGDGNGWVRCRCGSRHWGRHGAAGLFLTDGGSALLQLRPQWAHQGGNWAIPGGARDSHETVVEAAIREAHEETALDPRAVELLGVHRVQHPDWRYDTVIARVEERPPVSEHEESVELRWVPLEDIEGYDLHPGFRSSLADLLLPRVTLVVGAEDVPEPLGAELEALVGRVRTVDGRRVLIGGIEVVGRNVRRAPPDSLVRRLAGDPVGRARTLTDVVLITDSSAGLVEGWPIS